MKEDNESNGAGLSALRPLACSEVKVIAAKTPGGREVWYQGEMVAVIRRGGGVRSSDGDISPNGSAFKSRSFLRTSST